jgi:hypothetical protein
MHTEKAVTGHEANWYPSVSLADLGGCSENREDVKASTRFEFALPSSHTNASDHTCTSGIEESTHRARQQMRGHQ